MHTAETVSVLLQRQCEIAFDVTATLQMDISKGTEAGLMGYYDENSFFTFGICRDEEGVHVVLRERIGAVGREILREPVAGTEITLRVEAKGLTRQCTYAVDGGDFQPACVLENTTYLVDEGLLGKRFTGAMHGVYAVAGAPGAKEVAFSRYAVSYPARNR